jgi:hypothetical protein
VRPLRELARSYLTITRDLTPVMNRLKAIYRSRAIPCAGQQVYAPHYRSEWLAKIREDGVRRRAELLLPTICSVEQPEKAIGLRTSDGTMIGIFNRTARLRQKPKAPRRQYESAKREDLQSLSTCPGLDSTANNFALANRRRSFSLDYPFIERAYRTAWPQTSYQAGRHIANGWKANHNEGY